MRGFAGVDAALAVDHAQTREQFAGIALSIGFVVPLQRRQHERVVRHRVGVVRLSGLPRRGAAADGEQQECDHRDHRQDGDAFGVFTQRRPLRDAMPVRCFAVGVSGEIAESDTPQCAIGHGTPSLVFLRSGGVYHSPLVLTWWPRNRSRGDVLLSKCTPNQLAFHPSRRWA